MDELLKKQLEMYEQGDLSALEQILTSTVSHIPQDDEEITIVSEAVSFQPSQSMQTGGLNEDEQFSANQVENNSNGSDENLEISQASYPPLTNEVKEGISNVTKEWIRLDEALSRIRRMKREFEKERKAKEQQLLDYIEKYGLKDITKGKHQLVPKIKKGTKKPYNKKLIQDKLADFLNTLDIVDDVDEVVLQATDYLDNTRGKREDIIELKHQKL